ncbi:MAG: N-acetyl-gamma-glutamyl-phosphate reductase [Anaerovibrio sp.]|uniref:N-acetyl-gamma-glutamyl-phosphate reductase n=1 Tax=Anaerovibrio sp. TaxID=1872532 RepID=UPI0025EE2201|nr:N-acetyl-gamma-glutamyl-phosphate reductase [Anaerovibrio sp.]MCR5175342.1 N-acetyl-gamma-glutamyl-phosphate reductase [Anaerovibrio sp.]
MKKVSVIGATGYAGAELLRLLYNHPEAKVVNITSESHAGELISDVYPHFKGIYDMTLISMKEIKKIGEESDFVFVCLPHGHAMKVGKALMDLPVRIIDLGADYRFADTDVYEAWYKVEHTHKDAERVYGLAELYRDQIKSAKIIGNAGCYTTASILALAPLAQKHLIDMSTIIVDAKSGVSGAGRGAKLPNHFPELYDSFKAYGVATHRHTPEIEQALSDFSGENVVINFTPHLVPMSRGILSTCYATLKDGVTAEMVDEAFASAYDKEFFVRLLGRNTYPATKNVRGSNLCELGWHIDNRTNRVIVLSAIDNLVKGAAGQAVQNFNIASGFDEKLGLDMVPVYP